MQSQNLSRSDAVAAGAIHYFTGNPCKRGHIGPRYTKTSNCVECNQRPEHVQAQKGRVKQSVAKRPEHYRTRQKKWWAENRDKACAYAKGYRKRNPEKTKQGGKEWDAQNRDRRVAYALTQRAKRRAKIPADFDDFDCFVMLEAKRACVRRQAMTGYRWEIDHMIPLNRGGLHKYHNLQVIPKVLNRLKSDRLIYTKPGEWVGAIPVEPNPDAK